MADLQVQPTSGLPFPWAEYIGPGGGVTHEFAYAENASACTMVIDVPWQTFIEGTAVQWILGINEVNGSASPLRLRRRPPWKCPYDSALFAVKIASVKGVKWLAKSIIRSIYERARLTIVFQNLTYRACDDGCLSFFFSNKEWERYVTRETGAQAEFLTRKAGTFLWAQGPAAGPPAQPVAFDVGQRVLKVPITLTWHDVPAVALYGRFLREQPINILNGVGKINSATFLGHPKETLLLLPPRFRLKRSPYSPVLSGLSALTNDPPLFYDVILDLLQFEAPAYVDSAVARGHNTVPIPQDATGRWALITTDGMTTGARLHASYDFESLFVPSYS